MTKILLLFGNVLFIHVSVSKVEPLQHIVEIPYEIGRRLLCKTAMGFLQAVSNYGVSAYTFNGTIIYEMVNIIYLQKLL